MQEKDIREKLNQELDEMAPDILNKILAKPIEPVKSEKELFGKNKPLFKEKKKIGNYFWAPAMTSVLAACLLIALLVIKPWAVTPTIDANTAFSIIIDVNPSISISVNDDGTVKKVKAGNKDAKKIVKIVNAKIDKDTTYNKAVKYVIKQLNKEGYLKKKDNAMLLSVVSDDKNAVKDKVNDIKATAKQFKKKKNIKCTTIYQNCEVNDEILKVAEKNKISVGKAAFCIKLAKKEKVNVDNICNKNIYSLIKEAEEVGANIFAEEDIMDDLSQDYETESTVEESESVSEEIESTTVEEASELQTETESESTTSEDVSADEESESVEATSSEQMETETSAITID